MNTKSKIVLLASVLSAGMTLNAQAQQQPPQSPNMTFFVTSTGPGKGGDLGGLEGADRHCQTLATAEGAGSKTWRAYLSTNAGAQGGPVNARDRIGQGPGRTSRARSSRKTSTICTATATSSACRHR